MQAAFESEHSRRDERISGSGAIIGRNQYRISATLDDKSPYHSLSGALIGFPTDAANPSLPGLYGDLNVRITDLSK